MRKNRPFSISSRLILFVAVLIALCATAPLAYAASPSARPAEKVKIFKLGSVPHGYTYGEWSAKWWQWALAIPLYNPDNGEPNHPLFDGGDCSVGQSGNVWFLGGRFCETGKPCPAQGIVRSCTVPKGTALFFPVVNIEDSFVEERELGTNLTTTDQMRGFVAGIVDTVKDLHLVVDGVPVENLKVDFRVQSPVFSFTLPEPLYNGQPNNIFTAIEPGYYPAGRYDQQAVGDGYYVMLKPLPVGSHTIYFSGAFPGTPTDFVIDMTYQIIVK